MSRRGVAGLVALLGVLLLAVGLVLGFSSVSRFGTDCGSAFGGSSDAALTADYARAMEADSVGGTVTDLSQVQDACSSAVSDRQPVAWALAIPGGVLLTVALMMALVAESQAHESEPERAKQPGALY